MHPYTVPKSLYRHSSSRHSNISQPNIFSNTSIGETWATQEADEIDEIDEYADDEGYSYSQTSERFRDAFPSSPPVHSLKRKNITESFENFSFQQSSNDRVWAPSGVILRSLKRPISQTVTETKKTNTKIIIEDNSSEEQVENGEYSSDEMVFTQRIVNNGNLNSQDQIDDQLILTDKEEEYENIKDLNQFDRISENEDSVDDFKNEMIKSDIYKFNTIDEIDDGILSQLVDQKKAVFEFVREETGKLDEWQSCSMRIVKTKKIRSDFAEINDDEYNILVKACDISNVHQIGDKFAMGEPFHFFAFNGIVHIIAPNVSNKC